MPFATRPGVLISRPIFPEVVPPHVGSATVGTRMKMTLTAAENIARGLQGKRAPDLVNTAQVLP